MPRLTPSRPDVLDEVFDGEAVLVNLATGRYFALSPAATQVWAALGAGAELGDVLTAVGGDEAVLVDFAHQLADEALVTVDGDLPPRPATVDLTDAGPQMHVFTDMQDLLLLDPIHDVQLDGSGWPKPV